MDGAGRWQAANSSTLAAAATSNGVRWFNILSLVATGGGEVNLQLQGVCQAQDYQDAGFV